MKSFQDEAVLSQIDSGGGCTCYFSVIRWWKIISDHSCIDSILVSFELFGALGFGDHLGVLTQVSDSDSKSMTLILIGRVVVPKQTELADFQRMKWTPPRRLRFASKR